MNPEEYGQLMRLGETHWWFVGTRDILLSCVPEIKLPAGRRILDVGCGSGLMMKRLAGTAAVFGIDIDEGALEHCRSIGLRRLSRADAARLPFGDASFDLLVAADMLEHCEDDGAALENFFRVLAPGGHLLISVPAYNWLWSSHDVALHHKRRYTRGELVKKITAAGFKVERASYFNTILFPPAALVRITLGRLGGKSGGIKYNEGMKSLNRLLLGALRLEKRLLSKVSLPFGLSIVVLASRP
jgi:SAM-dependent methyltransferase